MSYPVRIGWSQTDITPEGAVAIAGQFHFRKSEGVRDPITATAMVLDSGEDHAVLVSCDLVTISDSLRDGVRQRVAAMADGPTPDKVALNATHTHTGPEVRLPTEGAGHVSRGPGVEIPVTPVAEYLEFAVERIASAVSEAWQSRKARRVAHGMGHAVVGRNRRWVNVDGQATMYGVTSVPGFSHIEGYEDHSLNLLAVYEDDGALLGLVVNVACPSQETEGLFEISADYWHETRVELRRRLGERLFVLPQCSAAGDQSPHVMYEKAAHNRMLELASESQRQAIARRIADEAVRVLAPIEPTAAPVAEFAHRVETLDLPMARLTEADLKTARREAEALRIEYEEEKRKLDENPALRDEPRWYVKVSRAHRRMLWFRRVIDRYEHQATQPTLPAEIHVIRLGDVAFATNPFEYYLDFGVYIKARSRATQTFLAQLTGQGTYVPSLRSTQGGGYGSIPASNPVGPEGGRRLAERSLELIDELWGAPG